MNRLITISALIAAFALAATSTHALEMPSLKREMSAEDIADAKAEIDLNTKTILRELYAASPGAKSRVEGAAGYAVFDNFGMKIFVAGSGNGKGEAVNNKTGQRYYMRMLELGAGLGFGIKTFRLIWIFDDAARFERFVNQGWEWGGQTTVAASSHETGGVAGAAAVPVEPRSVAVPADRRGACGGDYGEGCEVLSVGRAELVYLSRAMRAPTRAYRAPSPAGLVIRPAQGGSER